MTEEYEHSENKLSLSEWKDAVETLAAFATAKGGSVYFGIAPTGKRVGVQIGKNTLERLANDIKMNTQPPLFPSILMDGDQANCVITVSIEESPVKPVWAFGRPKKRVGRTNQTLSPEETRWLMELTTGRTWDALPRAGFSPQDIDQAAFADFLRRSEQDVNISESNVLQNLGFMTLNELSNGSVLLFAKYPQRFIPDAQVKCARFEGRTSVKFLDQQTLEGNVLTQLERSLAFVARNTQQSIRITGRSARETVPEYPLEAIREAVANSICHRDYAANGTIQIRIYDDRLEVWNPGMLPLGLTIDDLYREHPSRPRNPNLANALYRARVIEKWGTGTLRIVEACEARKLPRPEFSSDMGVFIVRFRKLAFLPLPSENTPVDRRLAEAISVVKQIGFITNIGYRTLFHVSAAQARRDLGTLVTLKRLVREGRGSAIRYRLSNHE